MPGWHSLEGRSMMEQGVASLLGAPLAACAVGRWRSVCRAARHLRAHAAWLDPDTVLVLHLLDLQKLCTQRRYSSMLSHG